MSKEKRDDRHDAPEHEQGAGPPADKLEERRRAGKILETDEGPYHGYSRGQVERMEAERNPPDPVPTEASAAIQPPEPEPEPEPEPDLDAPAAAAAQRQARDRTQHVDEKGKRR